MKDFDIIVVGGGHAGVEAALAAARMGKKTLMLCLDFGTVAMMPCNPSIGGTAKGHLVREIDALGGEMGLTADKALVQIKMLNLTKGPAVFSLRGQEDKEDYHQIMLDVLRKTDNLTVLDVECAKILVEKSNVTIESNADKNSVAVEPYADKDSVSLEPNADKNSVSLEPYADKNSVAVEANADKNGADVEKIERHKDDIMLTEGKRVVGVELLCGKQYFCDAVVLAMGVYLNSVIITGDDVRSSGPSGFAAATTLTKNLIELGLPIRRFKTGTPARIYRDSLDFSQMEEQRGENDDRFSFVSERSTFVEEPCFLTYTNEKTHSIILKNIDRSPLYNGSITGIGPRYCPSIETKIVRFRDKERHQIFVEPEGKNSDEMYVQGMSTSMPRDVQESMYRTLPGFENCRFAKYAYAIEYDCLDPLSLSPTLELKSISGLFSAGQMNGSSGYEEAAAQGLIAGINAVNKIDRKPPLILRRDQAYIGVLIDDLVTKGTNEPYRMMTARAEHRIMLRQDNADMRLTEIGHSIGLASESRFQKMMKKRQDIAKIIAFADKIMPHDKVAELFEKIDEQMPQKPPTFGDLCRRPMLEFEHLRNFVDFQCDDESLSAAIIEIKYSGYLKKQESAVCEQKRLEGKLLPPTINYREIYALRIEARDKLEEIRPLNLGQASRISGVSPADIAVLIVHLQKR